MHDRSARTRCNDERRHVESTSAMQSHGLQASAVPLTAPLARIIAAGC